MSKLMSVLGIILLAVGVALALVGLINPAQILVYGLSLESALDLIVGGVLSLGLGGVISALVGAVPHQRPVAHSTMPEAAPEAEPAVIAEAPVAEADEPAIPAKGMKLPSFSRKVEAAAAAGAVVATTATETASASVQDTLDALDKAKTDLENAFTAPAEANAAEPEMFEEEQQAEPGEDELYVVEDKLVRGRPARVLSDGTVEAETDEGWMRFENLEHLDEYLDAVEAG